MGGLLFGQNVPFPFQLVVQFSLQFTIITIELNNLIKYGCIQKCDSLMKIITYNCLKKMI